MAAMAFTKEFKVGINIFGVTNWVRTLKSIPPYWESFRKSLYDELGDPEQDEERLHSISPVFFGHKVTSPVLVVQGANDPRVLKIESDEMVEAIRAGGTYVDYLVFDDEGHGFSKKDNRIAASNKFVSFLDSYLK
jgi:dipeptidyl aminopeptidase/acylaminoacyl peptidase